jgi:RNA polymerase sigma-70 factor (ECF subfamily)
VRAGSPHEPLSLEREHFASLYEENFTDIYAYVLRRVDAVEVSDVVQDVFATAWRSAARMPEAPQDRLWLYGIARRAVQHSQRSLFRRGRLQHRLEAEPNEATGPARIADQLDIRLARAIGHLRPKDQEILRLILWDEIDRSDVAVILGCSTNAIDVRFHRALKRLRARFAITQATGGVGCDPKPAPEY